MSTSGSLGLSLDGGLDCNLRWQPVVWRDSLRECILIQAGASPAHGFPPKVPHSPLNFSSMAASYPSNRPQCHNQCHQIKFVSQQVATLNSSSPFMLQAAVRLLALSGQAVRNPFIRHDCGSSAPQCVFCSNKVPVPTALPPAYVVLSA